MNFPSLRGNGGGHRTPASPNAADRAVGRVALGDDADRRDKECQVRRRRPGFERS